MVLSCAYCYCFCYYKSGLRERELVTCNEHHLPRYSGLQEHRIIVYTRTEPHQGCCLAAATAAASAIFMHLCTNRATPYEDGQCRYFLHCLRNSLLRAIHMQLDFPEDRRYLMTASVGVFQAAVPGSESEAFVYPSSPSAFPTW
jgi:hypothetical protein